MSYEKQFLEKEKTYRPLTDFNHLEVIDELAKVVRCADIELVEKDEIIDQLYDDLDELNAEVILQKSMRTPTGYFFVGVAIGIIAAVVCF